jgi:hypothetical protein
VLALGRREQETAFKPDCYTCHSVRTTHGSAAPTNRSAPAAIIRAGPARAQIGSGVPGEDQNAQLQALFLPGVCFTAACVTAESDVRGPQGLSGVWLLAVARRETDQSTVGLSRCCSWEPDSMRQLFEADGDSFNDT